MNASTFRIVTGDKGAFMNVGTGETYAKGGMTGISFQAAKAALLLKAISTPGFMVALAEFAKGAEPKVETPVETAPVETPQPEARLRNAEFGAMLQQQQGEAIANRMADRPGLATPVRKATRKGGRKARKAEARAARKAETVQATAPVETPAPQGDDTVSPALLKAAKGAKVKGAHFFKSAAKLQAAIDAKGTTTPKATTPKATAPAERPETLVKPKGDTVMGRLATLEDTAKRHEVAIGHLAAALQALTA